MPLPYIDLIGSFLKIGIIPTYITQYNSFFRPTGGKDTIH